MKNLYIVTYYTEENDRDWMPIVAKNHDEAIHNAKCELADIMGIDIEQANTIMNDAEAFIIDRVSDYKVTIS